MTGDFNTISAKWWILAKENTEGRKINTKSFMAGYNELINRPTYKTRNSCINPNFTSNPNLISRSGVER